MSENTSLNFYTFGHFLNEIKILWKYKNKCFLWFQTRDLLGYLDWNARIHDKNKKGFFRAETFAHRWLDL